METTFNAQLRSDISTDEILKPDDPTELFLYTSAGMQRVMYEFVDEVLYRDPRSPFYKIDKIEYTDEKESTCSISMEELKELPPEAIIQILSRSESANCSGLIQLFPRSDKLNQLEEEVRKNLSKLYDELQAIRDSARTYLVDMKLDIGAFEKAPIKTKEQNELIKKKQIALAQFGKLERLIQNKEQEISFMEAKLYAENPIYAQNKERYLAEEQYIRSILYTLRDLAKFTVTLSQQTALAQGGFPKNNPQVALSTEEPIAIADMIGPERQVPHSLIGKLGYIINPDGQAKKVVGYKDYDTKIYQAIMGENEQLPSYEEALQAVNTPDSGVYKTDASVFFKHGIYTFQFIEQLPQQETMQPNVIYIKRQDSALLYSVLESGQINRGDISFSEIQAIFNIHTAKNSLTEQNQIDVQNIPALSPTILKILIGRKHVRGDEGIFVEPVLCNSKLESKIVAQDFINYALGAEALILPSGKKDIELRFLRYGAGFFAGKESPNNIERNILKGIYDALTRLFAAHQKIKKIKTITLPFYELNTPENQQWMVKLDTLCNAYGISLQAGQIDALAPPKNPTTFVVVSNASDPFATAGNEMKFRSVDATMAENLEGKGVNQAHIVGRKHIKAFVVKPNLEIVPNRTKSTEKAEPLPPIIVDKDRLQNLPLPRLNDIDELILNIGDDQRLDGELNRLLTEEIPQPRVEQENPLKQFIKFLSTSKANNINPIAVQTKKNKDLIKLLMARPDLRQQIVDNIKAKGKDLHIQTYLECMDTNRTNAQHIGGSSGQVFFSYDQATQSFLLASEKNKTFYDVNQNNLSQFIRNFVAPGGGGYTALLDVKTTFKNPQGQNIPHEDIYNALKGLIEEAKSATNPKIIDIFIRHAIEHARLTLAAVENNALNEAQKQLFKEIFNTLNIAGGNNSGNHFIGFLNNMIRYYEEIPPHKKDIKLGDASAYYLYEQISAFQAPTNKKDDRVIWKQIGSETHIHNDGLYGIVANGTKDDQHIFRTINEICSKGYDLLTDEKSKKQIYMRNFQKLFELLKNNKIVYHGSGLPTRKKAEPAVLLKSYLKILSDQHDHFLREARPVLACFIFNNAAKTKGETRSFGELLQYSSQFFGEKDAIRKPNGELGKNTDVMNNYKNSHTYIKKKS